MCQGECDWLVQTKKKHQTANDLHGTSGSSEYEKDSVQSGTCFHAAHTVSGNSIRLHPSTRVLHFHMAQQVRSEACTLNSATQTFSRLLKLW